MAEYWSPAPLPEGGKGKNARPPTELKEPADEELVFSPDSCVGSGLQVEIVGASWPPATGGPAKKRWPGCKVFASKVGTAATLSSCESMSRTSSEERGQRLPLDLLGVAV